MRFRHLNLIRYGKFTDFPIDLPKPDGDNEPDFHLIVGANEAGKSTMRHAITDLLFGIETRTRFDFIHDKKDMRLGAVLENDTAEIEYHRLKRNKQALCNADDTPLPEDALAAYTGNADRTSFEREFCLDHKRLETGGRSILDSKDDVGRMLFEASTGVDVYGKFLDQLDAEANTLWSSRYSKDREYYKAHDAFKVAQRTLKEATARTTEWKAANQKVVEASEAQAAATQAYQALEQTRNRLDRVRRVARHLQTLKTTAAKLKGLGDVIILPEIAAEDLRTAKNDIANAEPQAVKYQALINEAIKNRDSVSVDDVLLTRKQDIDELREEKSRIKNHPSDIIKREAESQALSEDIERLVRDLEWDMTDEDSLAKALPSAMLRKDIENLAHIHSGLGQATVNAIDNLEAKERERATLSKNLEALPDTPPHSDIAMSLTSAREIGNTEVPKTDINNHIERIQDQINIQIAKMHPWAGTVEDLRQLTIPGDAEVQEFKDSESNIISDLKAAEGSRDECVEIIKTLELKENQIKNTVKPITSENVEVARRDRDFGWADIKTGKKTVSEASGDYEVLIAAVDDLTDARYLNAKDAKELETLGNSIAELKLKRDGLESKAENIRGSHGILLEQWNQIMERLGLNGMGISAFQTWLGTYRLAQAEAENLADETANFRNLQTQETMAVTSLRKALVQNGLCQEMITNYALQRLVTEAETIVSTAKEAKDHRGKLETDLQLINSDIENLNDKAAKAGKDTDDWNTAWALKVKACKLPDNVTPQIAIEALSLMTELGGKLKENRDLKQSRIITMQRDMENFKKNAGSLAHAVASDLMGNPADEICAELCQQLGDAEQAQDIKTRAIHKIEENTSELDKVVSLKTEAKARLAPHMEQAKVTAIDDLEAAIGKSQLFCQLTDEMEELTKTIIDAGDGISVEDLEAEVTAEDLSTITARLGAVKEENKAALSLRDACILKIKEAETERTKIHGQADAATAEAQRQEALAQMADVTQRFVKVRMGSHLLRWSIERYRDEKRGPLLERASNIFSILTLGSFQTLEIDFDGDIPQLMGRRPDGKHVDFDGLSDGTGDQLFLSLRLAAVEMQLQHAQPLPFIADDLFVNYSDDRAAKGFKALGELATKSQVIYFTHHDHLVDVAREAIGVELNVISL